MPLISDRVTARCVDLFNVSYEILLLALERYFAHTEETGTQLGTLADATVNLMLGVLAPLGGIITTLPVGPAHPGQNAGPSFELFYESDYLMPHLAAAWTMLEERLRQASDFAEEIEAIAPPPLVEKLEPVAAALDGIADMLAARFPDWGATSRYLKPAPDANEQSSARHDQSRRRQARDASERNVAAEPPLPLSCGPTRSY